MNYFVIEGKHEAEERHEGIPHVGEKNSKERVVSWVILKFKNSSENDKDRRESHARAIEDDSNKYGMSKNKAFLLEISESQINFIVSNLEGDKNIIFFIKLYNNLKVRNIEWSLIDGSKNLLLDEISIQDRSSLI